MLKQMNLNAYTYTCIKTVLLENITSQLYIFEQSLLDLLTIKDYLKIST